MKRTVYRLATLIFVITIALMSIGCRTTQKPAPQQQAAPTPTPGIGNMTAIPRTQTTPNTLPGTPNISTKLSATDANRKAQHIASQCNAIKGVRNTSVVISGNTALVGVEIDNDYKKYDQNKYIKDDVAKRVREIESGLTNVAVTDSPALCKRISKLSGDVAKGVSMRGVTDEFTTILRQIVPAKR